MNEDMFSPKKFILGRKNKQQLAADIEKKILNYDE
jgi:hypothetical protein